jgi:transcriptional regulator of acetoin/glycerol metabolism
MQQLLAQLEKLAQSDMNILLTSENGTGKSMFAEYLHQYSGRNASPFIAVNMGAISEIFSKVKCLAMSKAHLLTPKRTGLVDLNWPRAALYF